MSIRVSPLTIELAETAMLITSPPSRLPATSNEVRVRVEFSKKQLMIVRPRSRLRFLLGLPVELDIAVGQIEDVVDVVRRQTLDPEQMPVPERGLSRTSVHEPGTIGRALPPAMATAASTGCLDRGTRSAYCW